MNERDYTLLNDYFNGLLAPPEAQDVRERAAVDPEFGQEFQLREEMEAFPAKLEKRGELKRTLENIELDFFQKSSTDSSVASPMTARVNRMRWLAIAASLALVAAAYWFLKAPSLPEYQQFAQHAPLSLTVRGVADQIGSAAEIAFEKKDYAQALTLLNQLLAESPNDSNLQLYKGICLLETDQAAQARSTWEPITNGQSALRSEAQWYTALSYLKEQNYASCKSALLKIQPNEDRYEDAQKLLKQLN